MNLFKSELRKLIYSRTTYGLLLAAVALASLTAGVLPYVFSKRVGPSGFSTLNQQAVVDAVYGKAAGAYLFAIILGVILMAGEFRQGTAVATFLAAPKRSHVFLAKVAIAAIAGAILQFVAAGIAVIVAHTALGLYPEAVAPSDTAILDTILAAVISGAVLAVVGVAVGTLIRNQMLGTLIAILWLNLVEPIMVLVFPDGAKWWATGAISGILNLHVSVGRNGVTAADYLEPWQASLLLLGYGAVIALVSFATTLRRDID